MAKKRTCPTTEEFNDYLKKNPKAKNKDIAEHFHIAPTTAAKLKSQIKKGTRPDYSDTRVKFAEKTKDLTPDDGAWWSYTVKRGSQLETDGKIKKEIHDALINLKHAYFAEEPYREQLPAVKRAIIAFYSNFRPKHTTDYTLEEFTAVYNGIHTMLKRDPNRIFTNQENKALVKVQTESKKEMTHEELMAMIDDVLAPKKQS